MRKLRVAVLLLFVLSVCLFGASQVYHMNVDDNSIPQITCPDGVLTLSVEENDHSYMLEGVTASDEKDGDITEKVMVQNVSKNIHNENMTITYVVADNDGHVATAERQMQYSDYVPPRFALSLPLIYNIGEKMEVVDRISATDIFQGDITNDIRVVSTELYDMVDGSYPTTFEVTNELGDTSSITIDIELRERQPGAPVIELKEYLVYLSDIASFEPMSYVVKQEVTSNAAEEMKITVETELDKTKPGTYPVYYSCVNADGVKGTTTLYVVVE